MNFQVLMAESVKIKLSSEFLRRVAWWKFTDVSGILTATNIRAMKKSKPFSTVQYLLIELRLTR
jgi:hypothetical protein